MRTMLIWMLPLVLLVCCCQSGCRDEPPTVPTAQFERAITTYLQDKNMDMEVHRIKTLDIRGGNAKATVSLAHSGGATGVKVEWTFQFRKEGSRWRVISYKH